jgi:hypothetical protein
VGVGQVFTEISTTRIGAQPEAKWYPAIFRLISCNVTFNVLAALFFINNLYMPVYAQHTGEVLQQIEKERQEQEAEISRKKEQQMPPLTIEQEKRETVPREVLPEGTDRNDKRD